MPFVAQHFTRTQHIHLSASPDRVFPLFDPIGEKQWADGWEPEIIYPPSGEVEEGMVFTTSSHDEVQVIWTILAFDTAKWRISYLRVTPDSHVAKIDIHCKDHANKTTLASISYTFTTLTEQGNDYVARFTGEHYQEWMSSWEKAINYCLQYGHLPARISKEGITITDTTVQSTIISAILAEWGDYSPLVEPEIFGTVDPGQIARNITEFCSNELDSTIAECLFYHVSQGVVFGLSLEDGRQIVIKVHPSKQSGEILTAVYRVQRHLAEHGFPCPEPILGPISLLNGHATVEGLQDVGIYADAHDPAIRRTMAETLYWLVDLTRDFTDMPGLQPGILSRQPGGPLWPEPHSKIFDFEATKLGSEWIDQIASKAMQVLSHSSGQKVIGHTDWSVKHFRFEGSKTRVIYDWDSLALEEEPVLVGDAARGFTMTWYLDVPLAPSYDEFWAFVGEYEAARGIAFTPAERTTIAASGAYALAYSARCENCLDPAAKDFPAGSFREALARYGETLLSMG